MKAEAFKSANISDSNSNRIRKNVAEDEKASQRGGAQRADGHAALDYAGSANRHRHHRATYHTSPKRCRRRIRGLCVLQLLLTACVALSALGSVRLHRQLQVSRRPLWRTARPHSGTTGGFAACLLVNDENPRIVEWIAYHYHVLPLRALTVAVDPASRSSPAAILRRWRGKLDTMVWEEGDFLPTADAQGTLRRGACDAHDAEADCLWRHRKRQRHFLGKCLADFKRRNQTWVLMTDVDEYVVFNRVHSPEGGNGDPDPKLPLDAAPAGVPTLSEWKKVESRRVDPETGQVSLEVHIEGTIAGLTEEGDETKNGDRLTTGNILPSNTQVAYGNVVRDDRGMRYFLRDDFAFRDAVPMALAPGGVPTLRGTRVVGGNGTRTGTLRGTIYNDFVHHRRDGEEVAVATNWREAPPAAAITTHLGGHLMLAADGVTYFVARERELWPPRLLAAEALAARRRLPLPGKGATVLDVLEREARFLGVGFARETLGPCLSMPRLLYGSREERDPSGGGQPMGSGADNNVPDGFTGADFVTLRYQWHAAKEAETNKFQKAMIDVSRLRADRLGGEAENVHVPLKYHCRRDPPRYSISLFRVNHYLDSFEAFSYRNDARSTKRQCRECYDQKGREAAIAADDDIRPWLKNFVRSVGTEKARELLAGAGNFARLS